MFLSKNFQTYLLNKKIKEYDHQYKHTLFTCSQSLIYKFDGEWRKYRTNGSLVIYSSANERDPDDKHLKDDQETVNRTNSHDRDKNTIKADKSLTSYCNLLIISKVLSEDHLRLKLNNYKVDMVQGMIILYSNGGIYGIWVQEDLRESIFAILEQISCVQ